MANRYWHLPVYFVPTCVMEEVEAAEEGQQQGQKQEQQPEQPSPGDDSQQLVQR